MKKKTVGILVAGLIMASLAGCGTKTEATDQVPESSEAVVDAEVDTEITSTEVIGEDTEEEAGFAGAENDEIVLYAEIAEYGEYLPMKDETFEAENNTVVAYEDIPVYNGDGVEVGYVKNGSTITLTESATKYYWARFENPIKEADYDYLYMLRDYIVETQRVENAISADEMKQIIIDQLNQMFAVSTIIASPTSDMEVYEFIISNENNSSAINYRLQQTLFDGSDVYKYTTFAVECVEDADGEPYIQCKVFYKDLYDDIVNK